MQELDACPLCRTVLSEGATECPGCGADLAPYRDISALAASYLELVRELLSRGETATARQIIEQLPQLTDAAGTELIGLTARLLLQEGNLQAVDELLPRCEPVMAEEIRLELAARRRARRRAQELYNHALTAARSGAFAQAALGLEQAVRYEADDPIIWTLKLKVELKAGMYERCYRTVAELDRLGARPPEFHRLEELLPPVTEQAR